MATSNRPATVLAVVGDVAVLAVVAVIGAARLVFGADLGPVGGLRESRRLAEPFEVEAVLLEYALAEGHVVAVAQRLVRALREPLH
ncbi:MAG: hypothetical protein ACK6D2_19005, partial [Planctomycetota bacterium]